MKKGINIGETSSRIIALKESGKSKIISFILCAILLAIGIPAVSYASASEFLYVNGVDILKVQNHTIECGSGTAYYDDSTNTLTLTNAQITQGFTTGGYNAGIVAYSNNPLGYEGVITVVCRGTNSIDVGATSRAGSDTTNAGIYSQSRSPQGLVLQMADHATMDISFTGSGTTDRLSGIVAVNGGMSLNGDQGATLNINGNSDSTSPETKGIVSAASLNIDNLDLNLAGLASGLEGNAQNANFRQVLITDQSTINYSPSSFDEANGVSLSNGSMFEIDNSSLNITPQGSNYAKQGIYAIRPDSLDDPTYVRVRNGSQVNVKATDGGRAIECIDCDAAIDSSQVNISLKDGASHGYGVMMYGLMYPSESRVLKVDNANIDTTSKDSALFSTGTINVNGGKIKANATENPTITAARVNLSSLSEVKLDSTKSAIAATKGIKIDNVANLVATSTSVDDPAMKVNEGDVEISNCTSVEINSQNDGIKTPLGFINVDSCGTFTVQSQGCGLSQGYGDMTITNVNNFKVQSADVALQNEADNININNTTSNIVADSTAIKANQNVVISGGSNTIKASSLANKGSGIYTQTGDVKFSDGARASISGTDGGIKVNTGNFEVTNCIATSETDFPIQVTSVKPDGVDSGEATPGILIENGSVKVTTSSIKVDALDSEYGIKSSGDIVTNLDGSIHSSGHDYGVFTSGMVVMKNMQDEMKTSGNIAGIVSKREKTSDTDDPNGLDIALGLIDFNEHLQLNVQNTGWINEGSTQVSYTTVAKQGIESMDSNLTDNDNNAWIKAGEYYVITYNLAGGQWPLSDSDDPTSERTNPNPEVYRASDADFTLVAPEKDGYIFRGWTGTDLDEVTAEVTVSPSSGQIGAREYTAIWSEGGDKTIVYMPDSAEKGSVTSTGEMPGVLDKTAIGSEAVPNKGYHFVNWTKIVLKKIEDNPDAPDTPDTPDTPDSPENPDDSDKGNTDQNNLTTFDSEPSDITQDPDTDNPDSGDIDNPGGDGGNTGDSDKDEEKTSDYETSQEVVSEDIKFVPVREDGKAWETVIYIANFAGNEYTVTFDGNGGSGSMESQKFTYGQEGNLNASSLNRGEYIFMGWSTDPNSQTAQFADGAKVINITDVEGATVPLYAIWQMPYKGEPGTGGNGYIAGKYIKTPWGYGYYDENGNWIAATGDNVPYLAIAIIGIVLAAITSLIIIKRRNKRRI